jgi:hypothetical protein
MTGWGMDRLYTVLDEISRKDPPKLVILTLDYFALGKGYDAHWVPSEQDMPLRLGNLRTRLDAVQELAQSLRKAPLHTLSAISRGPRDRPDPGMDGLRLFGPLSRREAISAFRADGSTAYFPSFLAGAAEAARHFGVILGQVAEGAGSSIDPGQTERLRKIAALARERGIVLAAVQMPIPTPIVDVLDGDTTYSEDGRVYTPGDRAIWKTFESGGMARDFQEMGIDFVDCAHDPQPKDGLAFADSAHPGEYLTLGCMIKLVEDPRLRPLLQKIYVQGLEDKMAKAGADHAYFDVFGNGVDEAQGNIDPYQASYADLAGRTEVGCGQFAPDARTAVILAFGQSNASNESDPQGRYVPGPGVFNFDFFDGRCYVAREPLLGASGNRSSFVTRLGDLLVRRGVFDKVLLVPIAQGSTYVADWAPGGLMHRRLATAVDRLRKAGLTVTAALWQQGEAEGGQPHPDAAAYRAHLQAMVQDLRTRGMMAPIYVAQTTVCRDEPNEAIRAAQRALVDPAAGIKPGPDTDVIGLDERWDHCHFAVAGMDRAAALWFQALTQ